MLTLRLNSRTMATILITGGTGLIGTALTAMLTGKGNSVILVTRDPKRSAEEARKAGQGNATAVSYAHWDLNKGEIDADAIAKADHIIHLAGAGVADKRWSEKRKKEIVESRTKSSALIVRALRETPNNVKTVVSASGVGWYGADPTIPNKKPFVETDPVDDDFLGETCRLWEESIQGVASASANRRLVIFRIGPVLSKEGGALAEFKKPVKMGVAAILGSGKQVMSWIHLEDLCRLFVQAIEDASWTGVYNAVAPQPADNKTITIELAKRIKGRYYVPIYVPSFLLKIVIGEMSVEVLKSATVSSQKLSRTGFQFIYPSIQGAMEDLVKK